MPPPELVLPSLVPSSCWPAGEEKSPPAADGCSPSVPIPSLSPSCPPPHPLHPVGSVPLRCPSPPGFRHGALQEYFGALSVNLGQAKIREKSLADTTRAPHSLRLACRLWPCHICPISQRRARLARFIGDAKPRRRSELPAVQLPPRAASRQSLGEKLALPHHAAGLPAAASLPPHEWTSRWGAPVSPPATSFMLQHRQRTTCFS